MSEKLTLENQLIDYVLKYQGESNLDKISNFSKELGKEESKTKSRSIDDRIKTSRYFYFPQEVEAPDILNCDEKSSAVYMAIQNLCPEYNPKLLHVNEGKRGIHASVVFFKDGKMHIADPNYGFFGPAIIQNDEIIMVDLEDRKIKFETYSIIDDKTLENKILSLRKPSGIIDFFSGAGQIAKIEMNCMIPYMIFGHLDENKKIRFDYRMVSFNPKIQVAIKYHYDPMTNLITTKMVLHEGDNWNELQEERAIFTTDPHTQKSKDFKLNFHNVSFKKLGRNKSRELFIYTRYLNLLYDDIKKNKQKTSETFIINPKYFEEYKQHYKVNCPGGYEWLEYFSDEFIRRFCDFGIFRNDYKIFFKNRDENIDKVIVEHMKSAKEMMRYFAGILPYKGFYKTSKVFRPYVDKLSYEIRKI